VTALTNQLLQSSLISTVQAVCREREVHAWLVGGAVRDGLLGRPIHDWDIAVEHDAIALARITADRLGADVYVLDAEHDTARVIVKEVFVDFARLRDDSIEADLAARDFTINALAIDLDQPDRLIDLCGGQPDLEAGIVRAIREESFTSDPIRLLRAVRLSGALAFAIDPISAGWLKTHAPEIQAASPERIRDELIKLLLQPGSADNLLLLDAFGLLPMVLPEVAACQGVEQSAPHHWNVYEHVRRVLDALELILSRWLGFEQADETATMRAVIPAFVWDGLLYVLSPFGDSLRAHLSAYDISADRSRLSLLKWAALLHDIGKPPTRTLDLEGHYRFFGHEEAGAELAADRLWALKFSGDEIDRVSSIIRAHMRPHHLALSELTRRAIYRFFRDTGDYGVDVLLLSLADHLATHGPEVDSDRWLKRLDLVAKMLSAYFERRAEIVMPHVLINGDEVMSALGLPPGKQVGAILEAIREAQAAGEVMTKADALGLAKSLVHDGAPRNL
jgi:putative nucleotidyltransferase with HDIG domain